MIENHAGEHGEVIDKELNESEPSGDVSLTKIGHIRTKDFHSCYEQEDSEEDK